MNTGENSREYIFIDIMKFIDSIFIVMLNVNPLVSLSPIISFFITAIFARIAVPFFFLSSGFFMAKKMQNWKRLNFF